MLIWDVTCPDTFAPSHGSLAAKGAGLIATQAEERKRSEYFELLTSHHFIPIAIEASGVFGPEASNFIKDLGRRLQHHSSDIASYSHILQKISVEIQRATRLAFWAAFLGPIKFRKIPRNCLMDVLCALVSLAPKPVTSSKISVAAFNTTQVILLLILIFYRRSRWRSRGQHG